MQLRFDVDGKGKVSNVRVITSSPERVFDKEAVRALEQWEYTATGVTHKDQQVQLNFELDLIESDIEQLKVTPTTDKSTG